MGRYLKFLAVHGFVLATTLGIALGGAWMWLGIGVIYAVMIAGDEWIGDDYAEPAYAQPRLLDALLYLALPTLGLLCCVMAWMAGSGDLFGLGAWVQAQAGYDLFAARAATGPLHWLGGILSAALTFAAVGTNGGHELTHRTADRGAMIAGRWLLALTFDAEFAIEHVYGHHRRLATPADPATARRGEHFYAFLVRSIAGQTRSAFRLERDRLAKLDLPTWSWHNRYLRGWGMSGLIVAAFGLAAGAAGVVVFVLAGLAGRTVLEAVNYFEHYGLVREPTSPIEPRHSWNSNKALSNVVLFNLARHSHHHAEGDAPFWRLRSYRDAPTLPYGYLTCMLLVYVAPGWYRDRMTPLVLDWDRRYANATERVLAAAANRASGLVALQATQAAA
ncbi:MAG TPA: alkane 1-monooxygenase [Steroidobacteraceae bacterium]|nr:alkane 1-monooxygenase [Steroidobacteraceae bacterium]